MTIATYPDRYAPGARVIDPDLGGQHRVGYRTWATLLTLADDEPETPRYDTEQCRTCTAPIIWATTQNGRPMPVDAEPVEGGNVELYRDAAGLVRSRVVARHATADRTDLRRSHFVTCRDAQQWRRPR